MRESGKNVPLFVVCLALLCFLSGCGKDSSDESKSLVGPPPGDSNTSGNGPGSTGGAVGPPPSIQPDGSVPTIPDENANYFYFSYDDSASTAAVELVKYELNHNTLPAPSLARPWEFLNYETFDTANSEDLGTFSVSMGVMSRQSGSTGSQEHHLGAHVRSPEITLAERQNVVLTLVVDVSGSMSDLTSRVEETMSTRLDVVKYGLNQLVASLKEGDIVNLVKFSNNAQVVLQNVTYSSLSTSFVPAVDALGPEGSTNLAGRLATNRAWNFSGQVYTMGLLTKLLIKGKQYRPDPMSLS